MIYIYVALGGAIGALLRFSSVMAATRIWGAGFPYGTMSVNIVGSFIMGLLAVVFLERNSTSMLAPFMMAGILGGFTTFSAFSLDAIGLIERSRYMAAFGYVFGSVGLSILALMLGLIIARSIWL